MEQKEIFSKLSQLDKRQIKTKTVKWTDKKTGAQKQYSARFITARTVMNMLDEIVGPENWRAEFEPFAAGVVQCTLFLRIGDEWIGKTDVGTRTDIEPEKGAISDALKRAAVHWGVGRELYNEGTASFDDDDTPLPEPVHDRTRDTTDSELDEYFPRDETHAAQDATNWTIDTQAVGKFIAFARQEWATDSEKPLTFPHLANRIIKALALDGTAKNRAELDALLETYTGSKQDAAEAVRTYKSED